MKRLMPGLVVMILLAGFMLVKPVDAQKPTPSDDQVNALAKEIYCPVCENTPLDVCPTKACAQWRELIRQKMNEGWTDQQIKEYFAAQYGDRVLAEPPITGTNRLIYFIPPIFILISAVVACRVFAARRKKGINNPETSPNLPPQDPYLDKVEEELKQYR